MWSRIKNWLRFGWRSEAREFIWHEPGDDNPFGIRVLDIRPLTHTLVSTAQNPDIAESFGRQRYSDGRDLIDAKIESPETVSCALRFPHNGAPLEGIVFKAKSMESKWDIYIYDSVFLFARSWTGDLVYRAWAEVGDDAIAISKIQASANNAEIAARAVYFLLGSHAMGRVLPHPLTTDLSPEETHQIALWSFSVFGNRACYATFEDLTSYEIPA